MIVSFEFSFAPVGASHDSVPCDSRTRFPPCSPTELVDINRTRQTLAEIIRRLRESVGGFLTGRMVYNSAWARGDR